MHNNKYNNNILKVFTTNNGFILQSLNKELTNIQSILKIDKNLIINEQFIDKDFSVEKVFKQEIKSQQYVSGILGILKLFDLSYLVIITESIIVEVINNKLIYEIKKIDFLPFFDAKQKNFIQEHKIKIKQAQQYQEHVQNVLEQCHYFSYTYPLTITLQNQYLNPETIYDSEFLWNENMLTDFKNQKVSQHWMPQMIQGYVGQFFSKKFNNKVEINLQFSIITRRSKKRSGTRCNHRGIDCDGNTANFVETETIYRYGNNSVISHIQIRGSAPVLWEQKGMKQKIRVSGGDAISKEAFLKHFTKIINKYGKIYSVTLMSDTKEGELLITNAMKNHYNELVKQNAISDEQALLFDFDIKKAIKGGKTENMNPFLEENMLDLFQQQGYFQLKDGKMFNKQKAVFRVNCKSSLDRTNLFQAKLGSFMLEKVIESIIRDTQNRKVVAFDEEFHMSALSMFDKSSENYPFIAEYKKQYNESGNNISKIYANTDALTSHVIQGSNKFFGKIKAGFSSLKRMYSATFTDQDKHTALNIILGNYFDSQIQSGYNVQFQQNLKKKQSQFIEINNLNVYIFTWNINALSTNDLEEKKTQFQDMFLSRGFMEDPDIIAIGIQEMVEIKNINNKLHDPEKRKTWVNIIENNLKEQLKDEYVMIDTHDMCGILHVIFIKDQYREKVGNVEHDSVKINKIAYKGAVVIRFTIDNTQLCFINAHLHSGNFMDKYEDIDEIHKQAFQREGMAKYKRKSVLDSNYIFMFGDFNFKTQLNFEESSPLIKQLQEIQNHVIQLQNEDAGVNQIIALQQQYNNILQSYVSKDEYILNRKHDLLSDYEEPPIFFLPTYLYDQNNQYLTYELSKKKTPTWADRIMIRSNKNCTKSNYQFIDYGRKEFCLSHHKPVYAGIQIQVITENQEKKDEVQDEILNELVPNNSKLRPQNLQIPNNELFQGKNSPSQQNKSSITYEYDTNNISNLKLSKKQHSTDSIKDSSSFEYNYEDSKNDSNFSSSKKYNNSKHQESQDDKDSGEQTLKKIVKNQNQITLLENNQFRQISEAESELEQSQIQEYEQQMQLQQEKEQQQQIQLIQQQNNEELLKAYQQQQQLLFQEQQQQEQPINNNLNNSENINSENKNNNIEDNQTNEIIDQNQQQQQINQQQQQENSELQENQELKNNQELQDNLID